MERGKIWVHNCGRTEWSECVRDNERPQAGELTTCVMYSVIFVHGLGSNPDTTWRKRVHDASPRHPGGGDKSNGDTCWVTDFLVDEIPLASRCKTRIFFYNYDSFWERDAVQTRLWKLAGNMLHHVQQRIRRTAEVGILRPPVLICGYYWQSDMALTRDPDV
jgi:hypothetical protein